MKSIKSDPLKALSDPLRISLFELIKEGEKTTPELADILNENRMNLYHHLKVLEQSGLIKSHYNSNREKVFSVNEGEPEVIHQQQVTVFPNFATSAPIETIVLSPPGNAEKYDQFKILINKVAELCGKSLEANQEILQVQVTTEEKKLFQSKRSKSRSYALKKK